MKKNLAILSLLFFIVIAITGYKITRTPAENIQTVETLDFVQKELDHLDKNSLVIFDIDDTLITPIDSIFHVKSLWQSLLLYFEYMKQTGDILLSRIYHFANTAFFHADFQLIDPSSPALIKKLQKKGVKVIAFTATITDEFGDIQSVEDLRIRHLAQVGINLSKAFRKIPFLVLDKAFSEHPPLFKQGILFANLGKKSGRKEKGPVLAAFLKRINFTPNRIIYVDDTRHHLEDTEKALEPMGIPFIGLHYMGSDKFLTHIDMSVAREQIRQLVQHNEWIPEHSLITTVNHP